MPHSLRIAICWFVTMLLALSVSAQRRDQEAYRDFRAELILAIEERDLEAARAVIQAGGAEEINRGDPSPLGEAVRLDNLNMVALMIRSGGDPDATQDSPLEEAIRNDNILMVRLLFQAGARLPSDKAPDLLRIALRGENAMAIFRELLNRGAGVDVGLEIAVGQRHLEATLLCLERGGDVAGLGELDVLNLSGLEPERIPDIVSLAVRDDNREAALAYFLSLAAAAGDRSLADLVLGEGATITLEHLQQAEAHGQYEFLLFLMEQTGEDLGELIRRAEEEERTALAAYLRSLRNERIGSVLGPAAGGVAAIFVLLAFVFFLRKNVIQSPKRLYDAVRLGQRERIEKLLAAGADPNARYRGDPVLNVAAKRANLKVVRLLLRHRADADLSSVAPSRDAGLAPLHLAARMGNIALAEALLRHGARVDGRHPEGLTPLRLATEAGHEAMAQFLVERGADPNARYPEVQAEAVPEPLAPPAAAAFQPTAVSGPEAPVTPAPLSAPATPPADVATPLFETMILPPPDPVNSPPPTAGAPAYGSSLVIPDPMPIPSDPSNPDDGQDR